MKAADHRGLPAKVLYVEAHADTARLVVRFLEAQGYRVERAGNAAEARAACAAGRFDVVISEVGLPDGDGVELLRSLRQEHGVIDIAFTAWAMPEDVRRGAAAGIQWYVVKPARPRVLLETVAVALGGRWGRAPSVA